MLEFLNEQAGQLLGELYCDHYFSASSKNQVTGAFIFLSFGDIYY
jgi:predicted metalloendopeptidase